MLVPRARLGEVEALAAAAAGEFVVGDPLLEATTHGPIANRAQFARVQMMIEAGIGEGAKTPDRGHRPPGRQRLGLLRPPDDLFRKCVAR
jgi:aldehyde dehydrogenase (NAD+)